jgi:hypothetical protein
VFPEEGAVKRNPLEQAALEAAEQARKQDLTGLTFACILQRQNRQGDCVSADRLSILASQLILAAKHP